MEYGCKTVVHAIKLGDIPRNVKWKTRQVTYPMALPPFDGIKGCSFYVHQMVRPHG